LCTGYDSDFEIVEESFEEPEVRQQLKDPSPHIEPLLNKNLLKNDELVFLEFSPRTTSQNSRRYDLATPRKQSAEIRGILSLIGNRSPKPPAGHPTFSLSS
jgi:hypothetical protein